LKLEGGRHVRIGHWLGMGAIFAALGANAATISSDFATDLDGWTISGGSGALSYSATGGNPGGYLFVDNAEGATIVRAIAPAKFLGDLSAFDGGTLSFDGNLLTKGSVPFYAPYGQVRISTTSGTPATLDLVPADPTVGVWTSYGVTLDAATWGQTPARWAQILANVTEIAIVLEGVSGFETNGFDNFAITSVPEASPAALALIAAVVLWAARRSSRAD
jgi:hypothetical protein